MEDLEIPRPGERGWRYRAFEMLPGLATGTLMAGFLVAARSGPPVMVPVVAALLLVWAAASTGATISALRGHARMRRLFPGPRC